MSRDMYKGTAPLQASGYNQISESARELLRTLLAPEPVKKGEGDYEIGREETKLRIKQSLLSFSGGDL